MLEPRCHIEHVSAQTIPTSLGRLYVEVDGDGEPMLLLPSLLKGLTGIRTIVRLLRDAPRVQSL